MASVQAGDGRVSASLALRVLTVGLFGFAIYPPPTRAAAAAMCGLALMIASLRTQRIVDEKLLRMGVVALGMVSLFVGLTSGVAGYPPPSQGFPLVFTGATAVLCALYVAGIRTLDRTVIAFGVIYMVGSAAFVIATYPGGVGLDVYRSHEAAAVALERGENPYTNAVLVEDGSPLAEEGAMISGYSYPPVTLVGYAGSSLLVRDSRWLTVVALGGLLFFVVRSSPSPMVAAGLVVLLTSMPFHRAIMWSGWTEPLTAALLVAGVMAWRRVPLGGILIGLALATKQYMVVLVPALAFYERRPYSRTLVAVVTAVATLAPAAALDFEAFWLTLVERPLSLGFRSGSLSLSGAFGSPLLPLAVVVLLAMAIAVWLGRIAVTRSSLLAGLAVVLGTVFLLSMSFPNYWWLVQWIAVASSLTAIDGSLLPGDERSVSRSDGGV